MKTFTGTLPLSVGVFLVLLLSFPDKEILASGVVLDSMGVVSSGRGGTNIAHADNGVLIHDNPAALVNMPEGLGLDASLEFLYTEIRYRDPQNKDHSKHEVFILPSFSLNYKKHEESKFAFGAGVFLPAGFSTEFRLNHLVFGKQKYRSEAHLTKILFSTSYKVNQKLSIGLSIGPTFQGAELEQPHTLQTGPFAGTPLLTDMDADDIGFAYTLGIQYKISENTVLGLSYVSESRSTLRGDARVSLPAGPPFSILFSNLTAEYDLKTNFEWPRSMGLGISHKLGMSHRFSSDVVWFNWASAFDRVHLKLTEGDNAEFDAFFGPIVNDVVPLDWNDTFAFRFGYEYFYKENDDDIFRFGYIFNDNPIPHSTLIPLVPGIPKHSFTFGYSHKWENWEIGGALEYIISDKEFVDTGIIVGGDFNDSSVRAKAYDLSIGVSYRF